MSKQAATVTAFATALHTVGIAKRPFTLAEYKRRDPAWKAATITAGHSICDETYGSRSFMYVWFPTQEARRAGIAAMARLGFAADLSYDRKGTGSAFRVSYFKGNNWDE